MRDAVASGRIFTLERPDPALWKLYVIRAIFTGPLLVVTLPYLYFRYHTLRYRFDEEGIHMRVGILFRREVNLTYARVQDIHLSSGFIQRWLGLADVQVQTASGSAGAEMVIEGFKEFEVIRDFLYTRMRGYQTVEKSVELNLKRPPSPLPSPPGEGGTPAAVGAAVRDGELVALLLAIRDELRQTREAIESRVGGAKPPQPPSGHV
jgi:putative membrane protein